MPGGGAGRGGSAAGVGLDGGAGRRLAGSADGGCTGLHNGPHCAAGLSSCPTGVAEPARGNRTETILFFLE